MTSTSSSTRPTISVVEFDRDLFTFDYSRVDPKYHASCSPEDLIVVYKGAVRGFHRTGFTSLALQEGRQDHLAEIKKIIEEGTDEEIYRVIDRHTSYYGYTPLLSTHPNPQMAQIFASTHPLRRHDNTIYKLTLKADRCII